MTDAIVDLVALRAACQPAVAWYDRLCDDEEVTAAELEAALAELRLLPPIPGRIGRALGRLLGHSGDSSNQELFDAFEQLRAVAGVDSPTPPPPSPAHARRRHCPDQLRLPGL